MSKTKLKIKISKTGEISFIYDDLLAGLLEQGTGVITRASHVEPTADGQWTAHMIEDNVDLGPFRLRSEALTAEIAYLEKKLFGERKENAPATSTSMSG